MLESNYKPQMLARLEKRFSIYGPVRWQHNNPNANGQQGIPDTTVFIGPVWLLLEVKASEKSRKRPNQDWWIQHWSAVTFTAIIFPENEEEVFDAMEQSLANRR